MSSIKFDHCGVYAQVGEDELSTAKAEAWCEAANAYVREDVWPHWGPILDRDPPNFFYYGRGLNLPMTLPEGPAGILVIKPKSPDPSTGGFHYVLGKMPAGRSYLSSGDPDRTFNHEAGEMAVNPLLNLWFPGPMGYDYAGELNDPVQGSEYKKTVKIMGKDYQVDVPNFVLPAYFGVGPANGRYDFLGHLNRPFQIEQGGYQIARQENGDTVFLGPNDGVHMNWTKFDELSRTRQLVEGRQVPDSYHKDARPEAPEGAVEVEAPGHEVDLGDDD
jgi:hypothetical protein